jgi:predicted glutamine amidotransferase
MRRVYNPKGNNAETLARLFEDAKDLNVYAHLRYKTKGATDLTNVHPFTVVSKKLDGIDVQFMHNGTLSEFGTTNDCDSKVFTYEIVRPLYRMVAAKVGKERALYDPLFGKLLAKYAGPTSFFTLVDSLGNSLTINHKRGHDFAWGWASNTYSFDRTHREPTTTTYYQSQAYQDWKRSSHQGSTTAGSACAVGTGKPGVGELNDELPFDRGTTTKEYKASLPAVTEGKDGAPKELVTKETFNKLNPKQTFVDVAELHDLSEVTQMTRENIEDMVHDHPEYAALLIEDLITELYDRKQAMKEAA